MKNVRIYTTSICPYCTKAKSLLRDKGVEFEEINVEDDREEQERLMKATGKDTVPQIFIDDFHVGGCDDLYAYENIGKLDGLLGLDG